MLFAPLYIGPICSTIVPILSYDLRDKSTPDTAVHVSRAYRGGQHKRYPFETGCALWPLGGHLLITFNSISKLQFAFESREVAHEATVTQESSRVEQEGSSRCFASHLCQSLSCVTSHNASPPCAQWQGFARLV